jgi:hypothetical protein
MTKPLLPGGCRLWADSHLRNHPVARAPPNRSSGAISYNAVYGQRQNLSIPKCRRLLEIAVVMPCVHGDIISVELDHVPIKKTELLYRIK